MVSRLSQLRICFFRAWRQDGAGQKCQRNIRPNKASAW